MITCGEKVSVLMTAYNQQDYIARALNSVLMQKTDFNFTIWIADDHSTDSTADIITNIIKHNQNKNVTIKHVIAEKNLGRCNNITHRDNILISEELRNQYVALCDGDDYWINDKKLQQQYDILRNNTESISIGDSWISLESDGMYINQHRDIILKKNKALLDPRNPYSQNSTLMFKNIVDWDYFPDILHEDWGFTKVFNGYGDNLFREITTSVYDRTSEGYCETAILTTQDMGKTINYLIYLLVRMIHYLHTDENLLLEADHNYILTKLNKNLNKEWTFKDDYFIDDKILNFVEQYKTKRNNENIPHHITDMIFAALPKYKIVL